MTVSGVDLIPLLDEGLGNSAYLVDLGDGRAMVVDASRDLRAVHAAAAKRGVTVAFAPTPTCTPISSQAHASSAPPTARVFLRRRPATASSPTTVYTTATRSTSAAFGFAACSLPATPTSTWRSCSSTVTARSACSPAAR